MLAMIIGMGFFAIFGAIFGIAIWGVASPLVVFITYTIMSKKKLILDINPEIRQIFISKNIPVHDGVTYLLCLYYGVTPSFFPELYTWNIIVPLLTHK